MPSVYPVLEPVSTCTRCAWPCAVNAGKCLHCKRVALTEGRYVCRSCNFEGTASSATEHRGASGHIIDSPSHIPAVCNECKGRQCHPVGAGYSEPCSKLAKSPDGRLACQLPDGSWDLSPYAGLFF